MSWRPWITAGFLIAAFVVNGLLLWQEEPELNSAPVTVTKIENPIKQIIWSKSNRRQNFKVLGMSSELANATAERMSKYKSSKVALLELIKEKDIIASDFLCTGGSFPQPYAALEYLVREDSGRREVVKASLLPNTEFESNVWFRKSPIQAVYNEYEMSLSRREDATIMAISAILLNQEAEAVKGEGPFRSGMLGRASNRYGKLKKQNSHIEAVVIDYFSLMGFLAELANSPDGICE